MGWKKIGRAINRVVTGVVNAFGGETPSQRERRIYNEKKAAFNGVNQKYNLNIKTSHIEAIAWQIGHDEGLSKKRALRNKFLGLSLGFGVGAIFADKEQMLYNKNQYYALAAARIDTLKALNTYQREQKYKSKYTHIFNTNPYAFLATGAIYEKGQAGSESFNALSAYDVSKGIYEKEQDLEHLGEILAFRSHINKAGNEDFFTHLNEDLEQVQSGLSAYESYQVLSLKAKNKNNHIIEGFKELAALDFNYTGQIDSIYKEVCQALIYPYFRQIISLDFDENQKSYAKALMPNPTPLKLSDFTEYKKLSVEERQTQDLEYMKANYPLFNQIVENRVSARYWYHIFNNGYTIFNSLQNLTTVWRKEEEKALFESEAKLMEDEFYIQKSSLYTLEQKGEDYLKQCFEKLNNFCYESFEFSEFLLYDMALESAFDENIKESFEPLHIINRVFAYSLHYEYKEAFSISSDELLGQIIADDNQSLVNFFEKDYLKGFVNGTFRSIKSPFYHIKHNEKNYFALLNENSLSELLKMPYKSPELKDFDFDSIVFD